MGFGVEHASRSLCVTPSAAGQGLLSYRDPAANLAAVRTRRAFGEVGMTRWIRRVLIGGSLAFGLSAATGLLFAAPAGAQGFTGCSATFDGVDIGSYSTPKTAKRVDENSTLAVTGTALDLFFSPGEGRDLAYLVKLELAGASWTVDSGVSSQQTWAGRVKVKDYATRG